MRFVRSNTVQKQEIVTLNELDRSPDKTVASESSETIENNQKSSTRNLEEASEHPADVLIATSTSEESVYNFPEIVTDSVREASSEQAEIDQIAEKAESAGRFAFVFGSASPLILVISGVAALLLWEEIALIVGLIASLIFALAAIVFAIVSLSSKYNTKKGRRSAFIGLTWAIPFFIVSGLILALVIGA